MGNNTSHRRKHRQKSHHQSHAEAKVTPVLENHPLVPTEEASWIDSESSFISICGELADSEIFSFDTEFIGEDSYYPQTCLIQVATATKVALIDPFVIEDLSPLHALIADPKITTLLHSGSQDLEPIARVSGKPPASIFDTQLAAGFVGYPWPISLTKTIESILDHEVGGHLTFSQWDARPLSNKQRVYAADDVRYLIAIHKILRDKLEELGRTHWAQEEFSKYTSMDAFEFDLFSVVKRICRNKNPRKKELQRIQAMASLREAIAIERDVPTRAIIPNECILGLAKKPLETIEQLSSMKGFPKNIARRYGRQILDSILEATTLDPVSIRRPQSIEKDAEIRQELDGVWSLFGAWCVGNKLSTSLVSSRPIFTDWFLAIRDGKQIEDSPLLHGWRSEAVQQFAKMIHGKGEITFSYNTVLHAESSS